MKNPELTLVLPCYNEAEHFNISANKILQILKKSGLLFEIVFVEDKSTDETLSLIKKFIKQNPKESLTVIPHPRNTGRGQAVSDGCHRAIGIYVGFIDIDCEISPAYIPQFVTELKKGVDVVCGERNYTITLSSVFRAVISKSYLYFMRKALQTRLIDTETGYKFFNKAKIMPVLDRVKDKGWFWDTEIMVRAEKAGLSIAFLQVEFHRRTDKTSTVRLLRDTLDYIKKLMRFRSELKKD